MQIGTSARQRRQRRDESRLRARYPARLDDPSPRAFRSLRERRLDAAMSDLRPCDTEHHLPALGLKLRYLAAATFYYVLLGRCWKDASEGAGLQAGSAG